MSDAPEHKGMYWTGRDLGLTTGNTNPNIKYIRGDLYDAVVRERDDLDRLLKNGALVLYQVETERDALAAQVAQLRAALDETVARIASGDTNWDETMLSIAVLTTGRAAQEDKG